MIVVPLLVGTSAFGISVFVGQTWGDKPMRWGLICMLAIFPIILGFRDLFFDDVSSMLYILFFVYPSAFIGLLVGGWIGVVRYDRASGHEK